VCWPLWVARLAIALGTLLDQAGAVAAISGEQREIHGQALADALEYRTPSADCEDCDAHPAGLCNDHVADLDLTDAYVALGRELGIEVDR
jgi:hypothetical protein